MAAHEDAGEAAAKALDAAQQASEAHAIAAVRDSERQVEAARAAAMVANAPPSDPDEPKDAPAAA